MTIFDLRPRACGKTTAMLKWLRDSPPDEYRILLCASVGVKDLLRQHNPDIDPNHFFAIGDMLTAGRFHDTGKRTIFGVDDVEHVMSRLLRAPVGRISGTGVDREALALRRAQILHSYGLTP